MTQLPAELRLLIFVAVQSLTLFASWRFVSRFVADGLQRLIDALLLTYVIQYIAVGLPGMIGVLSPVVMLGVVTVISFGLLVLSPSPGAPGEGGGEGSVLKPETLSQSKKNPHPNLLAGYREKGPVILLAGLLFILGYLAAMVWTLRYYPVLSTDALTYHLPAAVQWLQHGRIDLFQTWLFNPANTYSPLAGSVFHAWLLGPIGNDTLAHFASGPMVVLLFLATVSIARSAGASMLVAVLVGGGLALSHPIVAQVDKAKDDLFLAAFFAVAAGSLSRERMQDRLGPWRVGVAVGLCLAVKYTALLAMPMLLPAIDAPVQARWRVRHYAIAVMCVALLAGPWYLRNLWLTGNPLFPTDFVGLRGLFRTARSFELRSFAGVMGVLLSGTFAVPGVMAVAVVIGWGVGIATRAKQAMPDPLARLLMIGPPVGVVLLLAMSPYPEIRFILPSLAVACGAIGLIRGTLGVVIAAGFAMLAIGTGLSPELWAMLAQFVIAGVVLAGVGIALMRVRLKRDAWMAIGGVLLLVASGYAYVNWTSYVNDRQTLSLRHDDERAKLWQFVQEKVPAGETIAYAGTFTVYPLMGPEFSHRVTYVPVRPGLKSIANLPRLGDHLTGEQIDPAAVAATYAGADRDTWLANLRDSGAAHLVVLTNDVKSPPDEKTWADAMPNRFKLEYADDAGRVYRVTTADR